ncbi:hypothetical protein D9M72_584620 [compost metagenome]
MSNPRVKRRPRRVVSNPKVGSKPLLADAATRSSRYWSSFAFDSLSVSQGFLPERRFSCSCAKLGSLTISGFLEGMI